MKKLLIAFALAFGQLFAADVAKDVVLQQRNSGNTGFDKKNVSPVASGVFAFDASKNPESLSLSALFDRIGSTQGSVIYRGSGGWEVLLPGTSGYLLQTGGAGANPSWVAAGSAANPTASIGLTATNGVASSYMRSDAAPALDQNISPTMTGAWNFSNTTQSTSSTTGAVKLAGGLGVAKDIFTAGNYTTSGNIYTSKGVFKADQLGEYFTNTDSAGVLVNYDGYAGGTTRFRDFTVYDGKNTPLLVIDGSAASLTFNGSVAGSWIGTNVQAYDGDLGAIAGLSSNGLAERTGSNTWAIRELGVSASTSVPTRADADARYALLSGATMTGDLTLAGAPTSALHAATKAYVDSVVTGLQLKTSVAVATTANITLSGEQTIDGVTTSASRVLVKNQTTSANNGIYVSAAGAWSRATDADAWSEVIAMFTFVTGGTTQANSGWATTAASGGTLGSTSIPFVQFSAAGTYTAGTGLGLSGSQFSLNSSLSSLTITGSAFNGTIGATTPSTVVATQVTTSGNTYADDLVLKANQINETSTNGTASLLFNYDGYNGGTTQFRNTEVYDGKNARVATFTGSTKSLDVAGGINSTTIGATTPATGAFTTVSATGQITSTVSTGTSPFVVASTTQVANLNAATAGTATTATNATNSAITNDTTTNATMYPVWVTANTGNLPAKVSSTKLSFNPSTGMLTATGLTGPLTGNVTGNLTGNVTGSLSAATGLPLTTGVTGTLPVANGGTGITAFSSGMATFMGSATSANLRGTLTDETGTGGAVFATSPTIDAPSITGNTAFDTNTFYVDATNNRVSIGTTTTVAGSQLTLRSDADNNARFENSVGGYAKFGMESSALSMGYVDATNEIRLKISGVEYGYIKSDGYTGPVNKVFPITFYGAVGDDSTDNATPIANAIAAAKAEGGGVVLIPEGTYRFTGTITLGSATNVTIAGEGWGSILKKVGTYSQVGVKVESTSSGITIRDLKLTTGTTSRAGGHLLVLNGNKNRVHHCWLDNAAEFTLFAGDSGSDVSYDVEVSNNLVTDSWADGIHFGAVRNGTIANNEVKDCDDDSIAVAADVTANASYYSDNVLVTGNNIKNGGSRGILVEDSDNVSVIGNSVQTCDSAGVWVGVYNSTSRYNTNIVVKNNALIDTQDTASEGRAGILACYTNGLHITGNTIKPKSGGGLNGIFLCDVNDVSVTHNDIWNVETHGITGYSDTTTGPDDIGYNGRTFGSTWTDWMISDNTLNGDNNAAGMAVNLTAPSTATITRVVVAHNSVANYTNTNYIGYARCTTGKIIGNIDLENSGASDDGVVDGGGNTSVTVSNNY